MIFIFFAYENVLFDMSVKSLYPEVLDVLRQLKERGVAMYLFVAHENYKQPHDEVHEDFFKLFVQVSVTATRMAKFFLLRDLVHVAFRHGRSPSRCYVVGKDSDGEIWYGIELGCHTIFLERAQLPDADSLYGMSEHTISNLSEIFLVLVFR